MIQIQLRILAVCHDLQKLIHLPDPICLQDFASFHPENFSFGRRGEFTGETICFKEENNIAGTVLIEPFLHAAELRFFDRKPGLFFHLTDDRINDRFIFFHVTAGEDDSVRAFSDFFFDQHLCAVVDHTHIGKDDLLSSFHF